MLCGSSVARAAPTISTVNKTKEGKFVIRRINPFLWRGLSKKGECSAMLWSFNLFSSLEICCQMCTCLSESFVPWGD